MPWKFNLIAPRQGLFASLLIFSFALHTVLLVIATTHQLNANRDSQGQLMTSQLVTDSMAELDPANTVSLALLAERYASNPSVASIRILDAQAQVLATGGMSKTRQGEVFVRDALRNDKKIGRVEVTLIEPSIGEILRTQWLAILAFLGLHGFLWLAYRQIARPSRAEFVAQKNLEANLKHEIAQLTQALALEKNNADALMQQLQQDPALRVHLPEPTAQPLAEPEWLALNIQFYDPKQLMQTLSASLSVSYCNLCQKFLQQAISRSCARYELPLDAVMLTQNFNAQGATLRIATHHHAAAACLLLIGAVFQELMDVMYNRYRESRRFALQSRYAVSGAVDSMQLGAEQAASRLCALLLAKEAVLQLDANALFAIRDEYQLAALPNPSDALTRQAFMIQGLSRELVSTVETLRREILQGQKAS